MKGGVTSAQVEPYLPLVKDLARRFVGRFQCEADDLEQEGAIKVFQALQKGEQPAKEHILNGMRSWVRHMEYLTRYTRLHTVSYEEWQEILLEQEERESADSTIHNGGLDYIDTSEGYLQ